MGRRSQPQEAEVMSYNYTAYGQKDTKPFLGFNFAVSFFLGGGDDFGKDYFGVDKKLDTGFYIFVPNVCSV